MKRFVAICATILALSPAAMAANPLDVVINEVVWMGSDAAFDDEWIELYNNTGSDIDLTGWVIEDDGSPDYALSGTIPANGYFLIERREEATDVASDLILALNLGNSGDSLELLDDLSNSIDFLDTAAGWYAGTNNSAGTQDISMERRNTDVAGNLPNNWADNDGVTVNGNDSGAVALNATPKAANSVAGTFVAGADIAHVHCVDETHLMVWFTEAVTDPTASDPANYDIDGSQPGAAALDGTDPTLVHLTGIAGLAVEGGPYTLTATGVENGTGDPSNTSAQFIGGVASVAFARTDGDASYVPDLLENSPDVFITLQGTVTAVGTFTYQESYFEDLSGGLAIFDADTTGNLTRGDEIRISGKLDHYNGKDEIIETQAVIISQGNVVLPTILTLAGLNAAGAGELYESMLVGVAQVSNTGAGDAWPAGGSSANIEITDDAGTNLFVFRIDSDTDIDGTVEPTWPADVQGIASQYDATAPADSGYQILPRDLGDIVPNGGFCNVLDDTQGCYSGPAGTDVNAPCQAGTQTCDGAYWGTCVGEITPTAADDVTCDNVDDDCDGTTDEDVDVQTDPLNCGACDNDCTDDYANADGVCNAGSCEMGACSGTFEDCNVSDVDGCEVELGTDTDCSACGDDCTDDYSAEHIIGTCDAGACAMGACDTGWGDCDVSGDSCETQLGTDAACSACGDDCTDDFLGVNANGTCNVDTCEIGTCLANYADCDVSGDSCETSLTANATCGDCNTACGAGENCIDSGGGVYECSAACPDADSDGFADEACGGGDCDDADENVYPNAPEICDDVDNDCDTEIDEDFADKGAACDGPDADECANGTYVCNPAGDGLDCDGDAPAVEACDGLDNDCDGDIDEDWPTLGDPCDGPDEDECANGQLVCTQPGTGVECNETLNQNQEELCNGTDDDCDGDVDEGFGEYECGVGACKVTTQICIDGQYQSCVPLDPPEQVETSCDDGIDNDCDDYIDEADLDCTSGGGGGGCSCASTGHNRTGAFGLALLGLLAIFRRRRR